MQSEDTQWILLTKVKDIILKAIAKEELELTERDISFIKKYKQFYPELISIKE